VKITGGLLFQLYDFFVNCGLAVHGPPARNSQIYV